VFRRRLPLAVLALGLVATVAGAAVPPALAVPRPAAERGGGLSSQAATPGNARNAAEGHATTKLAAATAPEHANGALSTITLDVVNGGYTAAGIGMRDIGAGKIKISEVPAGAKVRSAILLWDVLAPAEDNSFAAGTFAGHGITGESWETGADPCWGASANWSYEADVTKYVPGNGSYDLSGFASGDTAGADPWGAGGGTPLLEGASLIVVYSLKSMPQAIIQIAGGATETQAGTTVTATMNGFVTARGGTEKTTFIVADAQQPWVSTGALNGATLPGAAFQGKDPQAVPSYSKGNLWDTVTVGLGTRIAPQATKATLSVTPGTSPDGSYDCIVWVGQVLQVPQSPVGIYSDFKTTDHVQNALAYGWTTLSDVAGLGSRAPNGCASPWTGATGSDASVAQVLGTYEKSHVADVNWLESFWTIAVPPFEGKTYTDTAGNDKYLLAAGEAAGKAAGDENDLLYRTWHVRPKYIAFDLETSPQQLSCGINVTVTSKTPAKDEKTGDKQCWDKTTATNCWQVSAAGLAEFLRGWQAGVLTATEDQPSIAAVYLNKSEYAQVGASKFGLPVIVAAAGPGNAFPAGKPSGLGPNVDGYAAYYARCSGTTLNRDGGVIASIANIGEVESWGGAADTIQFISAQGVRSQVCRPYQPLPTT
jgi:hypothetical protein